MARRLVPDIVTMDISLPDLSGLKVTRILKVQLPSVEVVVVTAHDDPKMREEALRARADAVVGKGRLVDELPRWLDALASR